MIEKSSFRDPSGFVFSADGAIYRQINLSYKEYFNLLTSSGLYEELLRAELLIPHAEAVAAPPVPQKAYKVIKPEKIPFISYPYEWCFGQLKAAALATLEIQKLSLARGMSLKDCSAYNIQFLRGKPVLIDTLSFEKYEEGKPWVAYRQFCQHFLAPLALMYFSDVRTNGLLKSYIDGIPLDLAAGLLPLRAFLHPAVLIHIKLHSAGQKHLAEKKADKEGKLTLFSLRGLIDNMESFIRGLEWKPAKGGWGDYYNGTNYTGEMLEEKKNIVAEFLDISAPGTVWDIGSNSGLFSAVAAGKGAFTVSFDNDHSAVEKNYRACVKSGERNILPLVIDITNPSPAAGWHNEERLSLAGRGPCDTAMALALVHHLAISNNLPLEKIAGYFSDICRRLIIEFVPKEDSQVQRLLRSREDIFADYSQEAFEGVFREKFSVTASRKISGSRRTVYLMEVKK